MIDLSKKPARNRALKILNWIELYIPNNQSRPISRTEIYDRFGNTSRQPGKGLKELFLTVSDPYYNMNTGKCIRYSKNTNGIQWVKEQLGLVNLAPSIPAEHQHQLDTGDFEYKESNFREYHPLQNLPKRIKKPLLASKGYRHEYDIQCCAQTLLLQHAKKLGFNKPTPMLDSYISNRASIRTELSQRLGLDTQTIKKILTAILNGGSISAWHENMIFSYVNYNKLMISELSVDPYIQGYQKEVRDMWKFLRGTLNLKYKERLNAKMKSEIYRELEESVRVVIKRHLKKTRNVAFIEHDGWSATKAVDIERLKYEVNKQTGFVIELDWTIHEYVETY